MNVCNCGTIYRKRCPKCYQPPAQRKTAERGYDNRWRRLSERKRALDPLCEECERQGRVTAAEHVHHIQPISTHPWLRLEWSNLMSVCQQCHERLDNERREQRSSTSDDDGRSEPRAD